MSSSVVRQGVRSVKPLLSVNKDEQRRRVFRLYKAFYREIPHMHDTVDLPATIPELRQVLKRKFRENRDITDMRAVDIKLIKGENFFKECTNKWAQRTHIMHLFRQTELPRPQTFLEKFYDGYTGT